MVKTMNKVIALAFSCSTDNTMVIVAFNCSTVTVRISCNNFDITNLPVTITMASHPFTAIKAYHPSATMAFAIKAFHPSTTMAFAAMASLPSVDTNLSTFVVTKAFIPS